MNLEEILAMIREGRTPDLTVRSIAMRASSADQKTRTVDATMATENPVRVFDMRAFRFVNEVLVIEGRQFPEQVPLLDSHQRSSVDDQLGSTRSIRVEGKNLVGTRHFAADDKSVRTFEKIRDGHITDGSVGYAVAGFRDLKPGESFDHAGRNYLNSSQEVLRISYDWRLAEDSIVPIGADAAAKMRSAYEAAESQRAAAADPAPVTDPPVKPAVKIPGENTRTTPTPPAGKGTTMFKEWLKARGLDFDTLTEAQRAQFKADYDAAQAIESERAAHAVTVLRSGLVETARGYGVELTAADLEAEKVTDEARGLKLIMTRKATAEKQEPGETGVQVVNDAEDKKRAAALDGLLSVGGHVTEKDKDQGMRRGSPLQILREFIGQHSFRMDAHALACFAGRFQMDQVQFRGANQAASSFSNVLGNYVDKLVMDGYRNAVATHAQWTKKRRASDFKTIVSAAVLTGLLKEQGAPGVPGEEMQTAEKSYSAALGLFHATLSITYQMWRNDDLGEFSDAAARFGEAAKLTEDREVYKLLLAQDYTGKTKTGAAVYDSTTDTFQFDVMDDFIGQVEGRMITVGTDVRPLGHLMDTILAPPTRGQQLRVAAGIAAGTNLGGIVQRNDSGRRVIVSPWLASSSLTNYSADDYYGFPAALSPIVAVNDSLQPEPRTLEISAGATPDRNWYGFHNFRAAVHTLDGTEKGDWS